MLEKRGVKLFLVFWIVMLLSLSAVSAFGFLDKFIGKGKVSLSPEESKSVKIRCQSIDYKYKECAVADAKAIISVKVKKKLSDSKCTLGKSFGIKDNTNKIWVNKGCRADFTLTYLLKTPAKPSKPTTPTTPTTETPTTSTTETPTTPTTETPTTPTTETTTPVAEANNSGEAEVDPECILKGGTCINFQYNCSDGYAGGNFACRTRSEKCCIKVEASCIDRDGGKNYYVEGDIFVNQTIRNTDYCIDSNYLNEFYCVNVSSSGVTHIMDIYRCPYGCEDGACKTNATTQPEFSCAQLENSTTPYGLRYHDICGDNKFDWICFNKYSGEYQGCGYNTEDGCTQNNANSESNIKCNVVSYKPICSDSDGGRDLYTKGVATLKRGNYTQEWFEDTCNAEGTHLTEGVCENNAVSQRWFSCGNTCSNGACNKIVVAENGVCDNLIGLVANPIDIENFYLSNSGGYYNNGTWRVGDNEEVYDAYSSGWSKYNRNKGDVYSYFYVNLYVFRNKLVNLSEWLRNQVKNGYCGERTIWANGAENLFYICNWEAYYNQDRLESSSNNNWNLLWANKNVGVNIYVSSGKELTDEEIIKLGQEKVFETLSKLKDNRFEGTRQNLYDIPNDARNFLYSIFEKCSSDIKPSKCVPYWECKTEPVICPPHGEQTRVCIDRTNCGENEKREYTMQCSPGICEGCYAPRYIYSRSSDNTCIPYGTRFEFNRDNEKGKIYMDELSHIGEDINASLKITPEGIFEIIVYQDFPISLIVNGQKRGYAGDREGVYPGAEYDIEFSEGGRSEKFKVFINNVVYSENPKEAYVELTMMDRFDGYCNYNGHIYKQKTKNYAGEWAKCQNNYECKSNVCAEGECVEVKDVIEKTKAFKKVGSKILCGIASVLGISDYNQCLYDLLGESIPEPVKETEPPSLPD